jgi:microcystin-dependent protein
LQGSAPMHPGQGQGLSLRDLGEIGGTQTVTLLQSEMPAHAHNVGRASTATGDQVTPGGAVWAQSGAGRGAAALYIAGPATGKVNQFSLAPTGGSLPHNNMQPYLTLSFCIALQGVFPARP